MSSNIETTIRITTIPGFAKMAPELRDGIGDALFAAYTQGKEAGLASVARELALLREAVMSPSESVVVRDADGRITSIVKSPV